jgi:acetyl-CoA carboxylase beta subunit
MPATARLLHLLDSDALVDLYPPEIDAALLKAVGLSDLISRSHFAASDREAIAAAEGTISDRPVILFVVDPLWSGTADPLVSFQRVHFVALLTATRIALHRKLPLISVYPSEIALHETVAEPKTQNELSGVQMTYLNLEMDRLSKARLLQITVLTDPRPVHGFSTRFPLGDIVLAEKGRLNNHRAGTRHSALNQNAHNRAVSSSRAQPEVIVDHYTPRQKLPDALGKLLAFCGK